MHAPRSGCPIGISLDIFGDRWSLLIVRDLMFKGLRRFGEFAAAGEDIATNVLSDRLARLEEAGIIEGRRDPADARKIVYRLTRKGVDLAPVLIEMILWADRYEDTAAPPETVQAMRADRAAVIGDIERQWAGEAPERPRRKARAAEVRPPPGTGSKPSRGRSRGRPPA